MTTKTTPQGNYEFAHLNSTQLEKLLEAERKMSMEAGKEIIVLAYDKK